MDHDEWLAQARAMVAENARTARDALTGDLERALAAGLAARKDVVVGPLESEMVADVLTFRVRRELVDADAPTPDGWARYPTSKGLPE